MTLSVRIWDKTGAILQSTKTWPVADAGDTVTAEKQFVENTSISTLTNIIASLAQIGINPGISMLKIGADLGTTVVPPYGFAAVLGLAGDGGVWGSLTTYYYVITATNVTGETQISREISIAVDVATKRVTLTWTPPSGATGYKIYRSTTSGVYTPTALRTTIAAGATATFIDNGTAPGAGSSPSANTTAGAAPNYGTPPTVGSAPIVLGTLAPGQMAVYWVGWVTTINVDDEENPHQAKIDFAQS